MDYPQKGFLFDPNKCLGCHACIMACATGRSLPLGIYLRTVSEHIYRSKDQLVKYYLSTSCNHCVNPECFRLCPERALRKRKDGIVLNGPNKCTGCGTCTRACPFGAPIINSFTGKMIKCDFCYEKIDEGEMPYCVNACVVNALQLIDINDKSNKNNNLTKKLPGVIKTQITRPSIRYLKLKMGKQILRQKKREGGVDESRDNLS